MYHLLPDRQKIDALIYKAQGNSFRDVARLAHVSKSQAHYI